MIFPESAEREYFRVLRAIARELRDITKKALQDNPLYKNDDTDRERVLRIIKKAYDESGTREEALREIQRIFNDVDAVTRRNLQKALEDCLMVGVAIELLPNLEEIREDWLHLQEIFVDDIEDGYMKKVDLFLSEDAINNGIAGTGETLQDNVVKLYKSTENRCKTIGVNEIGNLFCIATMLYQLKSGITVYEWVSKQDSKVRKEHAYYNGKLFYWNNNTGGEINGVHVFPSPKFHPGKDFGCRCVALPVIDVNAIKYGIILPLGLTKPNLNREV